MSVSREYPAAPLVGVGIFVLRGERCLIAQRGHPPLVAPRHSIHGSISRRARSAWASFRPSLPPRTRPGSGGKRA